jgi:hypothetical protein
VPSHEYLNDCEELTIASQPPAALINAFGKDKAASDAFCDLLSAALPREFDPATFDHE